MLTVTCDACDKPFTVADSATGTKVRCPSCGDVNVVPGDAATPVRIAGGSHIEPQKAASMGLPPHDGPEVEVLKIRPSMFRSRPLSAAACVTGALAGVVAGGYFALQHTWTWCWACLGAGVALGLVVGVWKLGTLAESLSITNKRVVMRRGVLRRSSTEMLHRTIQDIEIEQSFVERVMGVGTISIANSSEDGDRIVVHRAPRPYRVREIIDAYRPM